MLKIVVPAWEDWDPVQQKFLYGKETKLMLEHSLISISKWEAKYKKPYLTNESKSAEETLDYIRFMTIMNPNRELSDDVYKHLTFDNMKQIERYIADPMSATRITHRGPQSAKKIITSEEIYYSMAAYGIPFECQQWHFNRLLMLLEVAALRNQDPKKMTAAEIYSQNKALNAARREKLHSRG